MRTFLFVIVLFKLTSVFAEVDVRNGNFFYSWFDGAISEGSLNWQLARTYNSRDERIGIFGFGWCSQVETVLRRVGSGDVEIQNCGSGETISFKKSNDVWTNGMRVLSIKEDGSWTLKNGLKTELLFNKMGALTGFWLNNEKANISYLNSKIDTINFGSHIVRFKFNKSGLVEKIFYPNGKISEYKYDSHQLVEMKNAWGSLFKYSYDKKNNMTSATFPDRSQFTIGYDLKTGRVLSFVDRDQCKENYAFMVLKSNTSIEHSVEIQRQCEKNQIDVSKFNFVWKDQKIIKSRLEKAKRWLETENSSFGLPTKITSSNGTTQTFEYDDKNRILKKNLNGKTLVEYKYGAKSREISSVDASKLFVLFDDLNRPIEIEQSGLGKIKIKYIGESSVVDQLISLGSLSQEEINEIYASYISLASDSNLYGEDL